MVDTIPVLYEEYDVSFDMYINTGWSSGNYREVFRMTNTENDKGDFGDRLAMLHVHPKFKQVKL